MQVSCREATPEDTSQLLELFERVRPVIAGLSNRFVYKAIIDDTQHSHNVLIFVAAFNNRLVGYVIAAKDWRRFKLTFIQRHPLLGLLALLKRLKRYRTRPGSEAAYNVRTATNTKQTDSWNDRAKTIAKIAHIGVDAVVRSRGIGSALYASLIRHLGQNGFTRIDAHIDSNNCNSLRLHVKAGWKVTRNMNGFFAVYEIRPGEGSRSND